MESITQHRTNTDFCPVITYTSLVQRILFYKTGSMNSTINTVSIGDRPTLITSIMVLQQIRPAVSGLGADDLGFLPNEVGTHSIRSSTAIQLFLNRIPTYQIMLLGRWSSDAFLRYIRRQVQEISEGLSQSIVKKEFFTIPEVRVVDTHDPRPTDPEHSVFLYCFL